MNWDLTGLVVEGKYLETFSIRGRVEYSRVTYGGRVKHTVVLDQPITVYNAVRDRVILEHENVEKVMNS